MISMIKKISKELIDNKFSTRRGKATWYNIKINVEGIDYKALTNDAVVYYIPDTEEYDYIDALVKPRTVEAGSRAYEFIKSAENSELVMDKLVEDKFGQYNVLTCDSFTHGDDATYGYDTKLLKNFPKKNVGYSTAAPIENVIPLLVIRQEGKLLGAVCPVRHQK